MSLFFNVPPIGNKTQAQKGPTCWFYAAKMIRKFHDAYDKTDHTSNIRLLSLVRKFITFMDEDLKNPVKMEGAPDYGDKPPLSFRGLQGMDKQINEHTQSDPFGMTLYTGLIRFANYQNSLTSSKPLIQPPPIFIDLTQDLSDPLSQGTVTRVPSGPPTSTEYEALFKMMLDWGRKNGFNRQAILQPWNFKELSKLDSMKALDSDESFENLLTLHGPLWVGGLFESGSLVPLKSGDKRPTFQVEGGKKAWVMQAQFRDDLANTHAIAVLGIGNKTKPGMLLYRDPNYSEQVFVIPFDQFASRMKQVLKDANVSIMYYDCPRCGRGQQDACVHQPGKRATAGMGTVP